MQKQLLTPRDDVFVVKNYLTPQECKLYIERCELIGFDEATVNTLGGTIVNKKMRSNERVILDDLNLAADLWETLAEFVPSDDIWKTIGLNERFRFYRYDAGQQFDWHFDAPYEDQDRISFLTFMIYLNGEFEGGATDLFGETNSPISVVPEEGMALIFNHNILHRGAPVTSGRKYVMRSDIMRRKN